MRAAQFVGSGKPLELVDLPDPVAGEGEILVSVAACGICHTDLSFTDHNIPTMKDPPLVLGHEISGRVKEVGPGAEEFTEGEPVLIPAVYGCGECGFCKTRRNDAGTVKGIGVIVLLNK